MKKYLLSLLATLMSGWMLAQTCEWARNVHTPSRANAASIRQDAYGNNYFASYTLNQQSSPVASYLEKTTPAQQIVWQKSFPGALTIIDMEFNMTDNLIVIGSFEGTVSIDGTVLSSPSYKSTFLFESDTAGTILWAKEVNPVNNFFEPVDLFISQSNEFYFTSELINGSQPGMCAWHKTDANGIIIHNEFSNNNENRTYSNILADAAGNVFMSGTCGNLANFDNLTPLINESYQNFLVKYDPSYNAQWLMTRKYITFDHNNELVTDGQSYYWAFDDFVGSADTIKIVKVNAAGQVLNEVAGPMASAFFNAPYYSVDRFGNSTLLYNIYQKHFIFRYDSNFNLMWQDTVSIQFASFNRSVDVICYDSCFYVFGPFLSDSINVSGITVYNLNSGGSFPADLYAAKWSFNSTGIQDHNPVETIFIYPNPTMDWLIVNNTSGEYSELEIYDMSGRLVLKEYLSSRKQMVSIPVFNLKEGIFLARLIRKDLTIVNGKLALCK